MLSPTRARARSKLAAAHAARSRRPDDPAVAAAIEDCSRDYWAETLAEYVGEVVAKAPPLTDGQRQRIAALLHMRRAEQ